MIESDRQRGGGDTDPRSRSWLSVFVDGVQARSTQAAAAMMRAAGANTMQNYNAQNGWIVKLPHHVRVYCQDVAAEQNVKPTKVLRRLINDGLEQREALASQLRVR
jgi:hypothetical protein